MKSHCILMVLAAAATMRVLGQPAIITPPQDQTNIVGTTAAFSVQASDTLPLFYQWQFKSTDLTDQTNMTLVLTNVQATNAGPYTIIVSNTAGAVTSAVANLTVLVPPGVPGFFLRGEYATVFDSPHNYASFSVSPGANVYLSLSAFPSGTAPFWYQWRFGQTELPDQTNYFLFFSNVQATNGGDYTVVVTNAAGASTSQVATLTVDATFTKITTGPVVTNIDHSSGGIWGDYNNDGFLDLFAFNGMDGYAYNPFLFRNNGDGTFYQIASGPPFSIVVESYSACWGDYDNDGNLDLFQSGVTKAWFYHNNGDGIFAVITNNPDLLISRGIVGWIDYDNDGFLDLFVCGYDSTGGAKARNYLYRNNGDGTFTTITNGSTLLTDLGSYSGGAWGDYDNDGYPDLFLIDGTGSLPNRLYHNNGDGTFTRITTGSIAHDVGPSSSCAWGDYDGDGFLDLFVANGNNYNFLYHNNGDGTFTRITNGIVVNDPPYPPGSASGSLGCAWGDYDNDGWLDLYVGNEGPPDVHPLVVNFFYHNNGDGTFTKVTTGSPANEYSDSWGVSWGDYDNDGFLDLFASRGDGRGNFLYHNNGNTNSWLTIKLVGTVSNRAAIGARVRVKATINGVSRWQLRHISGGGSLFGGNNDLRASFGLGNATNVDTVRIEWPSGTTQEFNNVPVKQFLTVTEPPRLTSAGITNGTFQLVLKGGRGLQYDLQASTNLTDWASIATLAVTNLNGTAPFADAAPASLSQRFYRAVGTSH